MEILRLFDNQNETASIVDLTEDTGRDDIDSVWWKDANLSAGAILEMDSHWEWEQIADDYSQDDLHACVGVLSRQGYIEGAMAYQFNVKSVLQPSLNTVYIDRLATAPRNRP